ncbi:MAG TPA: MBOAT family O-acyltransferase [Candidatus Sulfotelmatobacter sp.]|nr:MBOAT family O-acyltransferase [Candidatus Sulfotelmatobacter sp.]
MAGITLFQASCYLVIFIVCVIVLAASHSRIARQAVLVVSSLALYLTWQPWFAAVLLISVVGNFLFGKWLRRSPDWVPLSSGILFNLALLSIFKYVPELAGRIIALHGFAAIALPLGISFWTFQAMSYLFDLYRGEELDPSFLEFALYMVFFPVSISGPVCRLPNMLPQFRSERRTAWSEIMQGLRRIAIGIFMMQLAKLLGQGILAGDGVNRGFDRLTHWSGLDVWCLAFGYGLQLFFDFAGYSHIAIGAAKALGIVVPENFARPFQSTSPSIFWTRWHMSLSFWIRDYVFLFLIVLRRDAIWRNFVFIFSMVLFGLWHRASLLFFIWGTYHGVLLVVHRQIEALERKYDWTPPPLWNPLSWIITMCAISLGWIFFRANSLAQAKEMLTSVFSASSYGSRYLSGSLYALVGTLAVGYALVSWITALLWHYEAKEETPDASGRFTGWLARSRWYWVTPLYVLAMLFVLMVTLGQSDSAAQFMYRGF